MDEAPALVAGYCRLDSRDEERERCLAALASALANGPLSFPSLVTHLLPALDSGEPSQRTRSTLLLATLLDRTPTPPLDGPAATQLIALLTPRLADGFCSAAASQGLATLLRRHAADTPQAQAVATQLFSLSPTGLPVTTRRHMLALCQVLLERYRDAMQQMETKVVQGFITLMDGERDPVNLLAAFAVHAGIMATLDQTNLGYYHAELFDVVSCYFPITFTPLPNDPHTVTPADLKEALTRCMVFPEFAPQCVPFLLDKLSAPVTSTKLDSVDTLQRCIFRYEYAVLSPFFGDLWRTLRAEILAQTQEDDKDVLERLLECLGQAVGRAVACDDFEKVQDSLSALITPILTAASSAIGANTASYASILHYACAPSPAACAALTKILVPKLRNLYLHAAALGPPLTSSQSTALTAVTATDGGLTDSMKQRETIVVFFVALLSAVRKLAEKGNAPGCRLGPVVELLLECLVSRTTATIERAAIEGVGHCAVLASVQTEPIVPECHTESIYTLLSSIYINTADEATRKVALRTLVSICSVDPRSVYARICEGFPPLLSGPRADVALAALRALAACPAPEANTPGISAERQGSICPRITALVLGVLLEAAERNDADAQTRISATLTEVIRSLPSAPKDADATVPVVTLAMRLLAHYWNQREPFRCDAPYPESLANFATALQAVTRHALTVEEQTSLVCQMIGCCACVSFPSVFPMDVDPLRPAQVLLLKAAMAGSAPAALPGPSTAMADATAALLAAVSAPPDARTQCARSLSTPRWAAIHSLAIVLNKAPEGPVFEEWQGRIVTDGLLASLRHRDLSPEQRASVVLALTWILKALAMRMASKEANALGDEFRSLLLDSAEAPAVRVAASEAFETVMAPAPHVLAKELHANVRFLWDQRFFSRHLALLREASAGPQDPATAMHAFVALSGLIKPCREPVLLNHLQQVMPMLIQQLKSQAHRHQLNVEDATTKPYVISTLGTLQSIFAANPAAMREHFAAIIEPLLVLSTYMHSTQARLMSVQILERFADIPFQYTRPHKALVTTRLRAALDDPKRIIRKCATETRHKWFSLTDPEATK